MHRTMSQWLLVEIWASDIIELIRVDFHIQLCNVEGRRTDFK